MTEDDRKVLLQYRHQLALDAIDHARICIKNQRHDFALQALTVAEAQIHALKPDSP
jgi:hypothetical protein